MKVSDNYAKGLSTLLTGLLLASAAGAQDRFPGIQRLMSEDEFRQSGLDKLSEEELQTLDQWLVRYTAGDAVVLQQTNKEVRDAKEEHEIVARITGDFSGWTGETLFRLDNGQTWRQRLDGRYRYKGPANPEVRISRNFLGFYRMTVIGAGKSIGVTPVR